MNKIRRKMDDPELIERRNSIWNSVIGKRITSMDNAVGIKLTLEDGSTIEAAFSSDEGEVYINGFVMDSGKDLDGTRLMYKHPLTGKYHY
jgi:hypothetical protein